MERMIAGKKMQRYGTRRLRAGDVFDAKPADARLLRALKLASDAPAESAARVRPSRVAKPAPPMVMRPVPSHPVEIADEELVAKRAEYEAASGRRPDMRWGVSRLQEEIDGLKPQETAAAPAEYQTRALLPED